MSADEFVKRFDRLCEEVGHGDLTGRIECDQVYAQYQHEGLNLKHPHGGKAKFLSEPLQAMQTKMMQDLAESAITSEGSELQSQMEGSMEDLARAAAGEAPIEWGDLRNSMHPTVSSGGRVVWDRPPKARRLTEEELRAKSRWRQ